MKNNNTNNNNNTTTVIEFKQVARKNEKVLVYDIRCALIDNDFSSLLSLCKGWIHMVDNGVVSDNDVRRMASELRKVAYTGKYASVNGRKDGKDGELNVITSGRVKAWLYTIRRNSYKALTVNAEKGERPEEKTVKQANKKTTVKIDAETLEMLETIKALKAAGLSKEQMNKWFETMAQ